MLAQQAFESAAKGMIMSENATNQAQCRCTETCVWREDEDGMWDTDCNGRFEFTDGGPIENRFIACPYCGASLQEIRYAPPDGDCDSQRGP